MDSKIPKYIFEPYVSVRESKHQCPYCGHKNVFTRYIDVTTGQYMGEEFGICDRANNCGIHKYPSKATVPTMRAKKEYRVVERNPSFIPYTTFMDSVGKRCNLFKYLISKFPPSAVERVFNLYCVGGSDKWGGATVFWQLDQDKMVRTGKIMQYKDGRRVKEPFARIHWAHNDIEDFVLRQVLFGRHLIQNGEVVNVVESEKTALICNIIAPEKRFVATGGIQNLSKKRFEGLDNHLILYPDLGAEEEWDKKLSKSGLSYEVSDFLTNKVEVGEDLADFILQNLKR